MKTVIDTSDLKIINGDSLITLRTIADDSVDAVITDPPYSSGGMSVTSRKVAPASKYQSSRAIRRYPELLGDSRDQRSLLLWSILWLSECWRISVLGAPLLMFSDWRQLPLFSDAVQAAGWTWRGIVVWDKTSMARPNKGAFRAQVEYIIFAAKGKWRPQADVYLPGVLRFPVKANEKNHITAKPVPLMTELMRILPEGATILDPFLGGGATAKACLNSGRKCIGVELNPDTINAAIELIENNKVVTSSRISERPLLFPMDEAENFEAG